MVNDAQQAEWALLPPTPEVSSQLWRVSKVFASGVVGGALSLFSLGVLVAPMTVQTCGATRSLQIDRERQQRCLELGVTPEELAELEAAEAAPENAP